MRRPLLLLAVLLLWLPGWSETPIVTAARQALARPTPTPNEQKAWLEGLGFDVDATGATLEHDEGPLVVLWAKDTPPARYAIAGMTHLKRFWRGTLEVRLGDPGPEPSPGPRLILRARIGDSLNAGQVAIPRSDYRSHIDVIAIEVPSSADQDSGVACAEVLLALRSEEADPLEDVVLNVEKFSVGHIVVSLKTYDNETRKRSLDKLQKLVKAAAPQATLQLPHDEFSGPAFDWAFRLRRALARDLGAERLQMESPVEEDSRYQEMALAWNCPAAAIWVGRQDDPKQSALAIILALLEAFK